MKKLFLLAVVISFAFVSFAADTVTGNLKYQDYKFGLNGYTGATQLLPVRHLKIRVVNGSGTQLGSGFTDDAGNYSISFTNPSTQNIYLLASCEGDASNGYPLYVVDTLKNGRSTSLSSLSFISTYIDTVLNHVPGNSPNAGNAVLFAKSSVSIVQAFNIFDCGVDAFNWISSSEARGSKVLASELLIYEWSATRQIPGANYSNHTIRMGTPAYKDGPTSGFADMIVLHETGHYIDDVILNYVSTNPGGQHFINDNYQDPRLSWGEGWPTFIAGSILKWKQTNGEPISPLSSSIYSDMGNPPSWPPANGTALNFSYDFEVDYSSQRGSANENNITSALWDIIDSPSTQDFSAGTDDENLTVPFPTVWNVFKKLGPLGKNLTLDDFWVQWFATNSGSDDEMKNSFVTVNQLPYFSDSSEPGSNSQETSAVLPAQDIRTQGANNGVVIYEVEVGDLDGVELMNTTNESVNISGWKFQAGVNTIATVFYTFPANTVLEANGIIRVLESGSSDQNKPGTVFIGTNISWNYDTNGACALLNSSNIGIDFVKWGGNTSLSIPSGTSFSGTLSAPLSPNSLQRSINGSDTNDASDFTSKTPTFGYINTAINFLNNTFYAENDIDFYALKGVAGNTFTVFADGFVSATLPVIAITNSNGNIITSAAAASSQDQLSLKITLPDTNLYFVKFFNTSPYSLFGEYKLSVLQTNDDAFKPFAPVGFDYVVNNGIVLSWVNGSLYDSVTVFRDDVRIGQTTSTSFEDHSVADKSFHLYSIEGWKNSVASGTKTELAAVNSKALSSYTNSFETKIEQKFWLIDGDWGVENGKGVGNSIAFTDSPGDDYLNSTDSRIELTVPVLVTSGNKLLFSHVALLEPGDADGDWDWGKVEVRKKGSPDWIDVTSQLTTAIPSLNGGKIMDARMYSDWMDILDNPTNIPSHYKNESFTLSSIPGVVAGDTIYISFHMFSDEFVTYDGWYLDNIEIKGNGVSVNENETAIANKFELFKAYPNPFNPSTNLKFTVAKTSVATLSIYNLLGQKVNTLFNESAEHGKLYSINWNGKNDFGQVVSSGVYFVVLQQDNNFKTTKITFLK